MITVNALKEYGANVEEGLSRCMGNEALYLKLAAIIPGDKNFQTLEESLAAGNLDSAFESALALKGATGNLSLTPLYDPLVKITELLRAREDMDYTELMNDILSERSKLEERCR
ncbi:MAG: Hpt domain-containing protein [Eubacterium sp.]|nr:Hpt domain-containing protein [Eubacterium sp.]